ncbi:hypothetical protein U14_01883 [Candidatus Moduliflexus flocculans]|uniref:Flagellar biosynthesis protein FlgM n=1 Tax=Candidatus Moduliflexus flocculans TaxID=1499966 RepID=A0A0S6VT07_9BACT|nr:hypothetical protein U14_01883 [Candidatus Moduliflexus flocculans]
MRWKDGRRSDNVEDRRSVTPGRVVGGGGLGIIVIALIAMFFGVDPSQLLQILNQTGLNQTTQEEPSSRSTQPRPDDELADFVSVVLADTEDVWTVLFKKMNETYQKPRLVLFSGAVQSACGFAQAAMGPFYCPADQKVYIDLSFYQDLRDRFKAPGDFAQAYVIAHEIGHHVQKLLGISDQVQQARQQASETQANKLSVMLELQADCLAGVWAYHAQKMRNILEEGDIEEALNAASSIGDDRIQKQSRGYVTPDSFTHGSSEQRVRWFSAGFKSGRPDSCNTFEAKKL